MDEAPTLRELQAIITRFMTHEIEEKEAFELVIETLEKAGFGSVAGLVEVANEGG
jgi:hypothetical protein